MKVYRPGQLIYSLDSSGGSGHPVGIVTGVPQYEISADTVAEAISRLAGPAEATLWLEGASQLTLFVRDGRLRCRSALGVPVLPIGQQLLEIEKPRPENWSFPRAEGETMRIVRMEPRSGRLTTHEEYAWNVLRARFPPEKRSVMVRRLERWCAGCHVVWRGGAWSRI